MALWPKIRAALYAPRMERLADAYSVGLSEQERLDTQLRLWNTEWQRILASVPYYQQLKRQLGLPEQFRSWEEFAESLPVTRREAVQKNMRAMTSTERPPDGTRVTGGSTAQPVQMPAWRSEDIATRYNTWLGRSWYGVSPSSRLFMLWGHSHLFGIGIPGWLKARKRELLDRALGYKRFSAYQLRPEALRRAAEELVKFKPEYAIGYSVALDLLARANQDRREELRKLGLKVVVGTAECFPASDSAALLQDLFGCPVGMEYGAVESGVIAHTHPEGRYRVFWKSYFLEGEKDEHEPGGLSVRLTSLYPRSFPLVRYDLGDQIGGDECRSNRLIGIGAFEGVIGRRNAYAALRDGSILHFETFDTAIRDCPYIRAFQVIQDGADIRLHYLSGDPLSQDWVSTIQRRLAIVHPSLAALEITRVEQLEQTIAGKGPMVIRRPLEWRQQPAERTRPVGHPERSEGSLGFARSRGIEERQRSSVASSPSGRQSSGSLGGLVCWSRVRQRNQMAASLRFRALLYRRPVQRVEAAYSAPVSEQERLDRQLRLWNTEWQRILATVPYYQQLKRQLGLPEQFRSWEEFGESLPVTRRDNVQENIRAMTSTERPPQVTRVTGGSTAEPVQLPAWRSEDESIRYNAWLGRGWYGVSPSSPLFMLWGHSHLFGIGIRGWLKARKRELLDRALGCKRFSAYQLRPEALRRGAEELLKFKPEYMIGYSVALDLFARANQDRREELRKVGLKVVIGTAECFPASDSAALLQDLFGCPVGMEYGAVETGVIAHTHPEGRYRVFWKSYFLEGEKDEHEPGGLSVRLTSLYPRSFPLVRYDLGDRILGADAGAERLIGMEAFQEVVGRCNAYGVLQDGSVVHSEMFTHAVKDCPNVRAYQVVQDGYDIQLRYLSGEALSQEWLSRIRSRLGRIYPGLAGIDIRRVEQLEQTVAGKTPMLIRRKDSVIPRLGPAAPAKPVAGRN